MSSIDFTTHSKEGARLRLYAVTWLLIAAVMSCLIAAAAAIFYRTIEFATRLREARPWLIWLLPVAGVLLGWLGVRMKETSGERTLVVDALHEPNAGMGWPRAAFDFLRAAATHLCGGSAGWERLPLQVGAKVGHEAAVRVEMRTTSERRVALMAGVAGAFGAVFGTPLAAAVFAVEVLAVDKLRYKSLLPCLMTALFSNAIFRALSQSPYHFEKIPALSQGHALLVVVKAAAAGLVIGTAGRMTVAILRTARALFQRLGHPAVQAAAGGAAVSSFALFGGMQGFVGLGITTSPGLPTLASMVNGEPISKWWSFAGKALVTSLTLGSGFGGGEVAPLLYIGSSLGCALSSLAGLPPNLMAPLGFCAALASVTDAPLACSILGFELFGAGNVTLFAIACFAAGSLNRIKLVDSSSLLRDI